MEYETIDSKQIDQIMEGRKPGPPADWNDSDKPQGGSPEINDDLHEAASDDASDTASEDGAAPTN